jgi:hypothetical protein
VNLVSFLATFLELSVISMLIFDLKNQILYEMLRGTVVKGRFGSRCLASSQRLTPADSNLLIIVKTQRTLLLQAGFRKFQDVRSGEETNVFF